MAYNRSLIFDFHRKQKKRSWPLVPSGDHISNYNFQTGISFDRIQVIDVFLPCFAAIETAPYSNAAGTVWLKNDRQDILFKALKKASASLVVDIARLIVDGEAAARTVGKNLEAQLHLAPQARKEIPRPKVREILCLHQTFAFGNSWDANELWPLAFKPFINVKSPFQFETDLSLFWESRPGRSPATLQGQKMTIDKTALHMREAEERLETTATMDPAVEAQEEKVSKTFQAQFDADVAGIEERFDTSYD